MSHLNVGCALKQLRFLFCCEFSVPTLPFAFVTVDSFYVSNKSPAPNWHVFVNVQSSSFAPLQHMCEYSSVHNSHGLSFVCSVAHTDPCLIIFMNTVF